MSDWDASKFYEDNEQNQASFLVGTSPIHTDLRSHLSLALKQILHEKLDGYPFLATVHTQDGDVSLAPEQYRALLEIRRAKDIQADSPA
jgi:hypothetical protein